MKRIAAVLVLVIGCAIVSCSRDRTLTEERARRIILGQTFEIEPAYAEVPRTVSWSADSPKDDFDERSLRTLENLERAGLVSVKRSVPDDGSGSWTASVTGKGFTILGDVPSSRGPAYRARIADRQVVGVRNFVRHSDNPSVGRAELVWHYRNPTPLYDVFETKMDKPIGPEFVSVVSVYWERGAWHVRTLVAKQRAEPGT